MKKITKVIIILFIIIIILFTILAYLMFKGVINNKFIGHQQINKKDDLLLQLDKKAHDLLCAEDDRGMAAHERGQQGYGFDIYFQYYNKIEKEFIDLQTQYKLKTGLDYPRPQLNSPPTNCPPVK